MARRKKMTVDEYIANRDDLTFIVVAPSPNGFEIVLRLDGTYYDEEVAQEQAKFVSKTLGITLGPK